MKLEVVGAVFFEDPCFTIDDFLVKPARTEVRSRRGGFFEDPCFTIDDSSLTLACTA